MDNIKHCTICNSDQIHSIYWVPDRHYGIQGEYNISKCNTCGLVFLNPMPNEKELADFYPQESYYSYNISYKRRNSVKNLISSMLFLGYEPKDNKLLTKMGNGKGKKMLDVGCGNGWFIYQWKNRGWDVYGVEPGLNGAKTGRKAGLNIHHGDLLSAKFESESFEYIRLNHSFEHIHNPDEILQEIHRILKPEGTLFIGVPNINSFNGKLFKQYWYYLGAPFHTYSYSDKTLPVFLEKQGFKVKKIMYNSWFMGLLGSFQIFLNRKSGKPSEQGFFIENKLFQTIAGFVSRLTNLFHVGDCIEVIAVKK